MKSILVIAMLGLMATPAVSETPAGFVPLSINTDLQKTPVDIEGWHDGGVWYPAGGGGKLTTMENPVFYGTPQLDGADIADGKYPLILVSHGMGGNIFSISWLTAGLAQKGAIVVSVNHPASTTFDMDMTRMMDHWTRAQDLSAALDMVLADERFSGHIDTNHIYVTGFSYGGWTALSMAGLTANVEGLADYCDRMINESGHCREMAQAQVNLHAFDPAIWDKSYKDPRISAAVGIDPALHFDLTVKNTENLVDDILLIGLGQGEDRLRDTDFSETGTNFASLLPNAEIETIIPASHFSALLVCKPNGAQILKEEGEEYPACDDPEGSDRQAVHNIMLDRIADFLKL